MHPSTILGSGLLASTLREALPHLAGMAMVMMVLAMLWGLCVAIDKLLQWIPGLRPPAATVMDVSTVPSLPPSSEPEVSPEITAVIAAAVAVVSGPSVRVISIKPVNPNWEKAGRQAVLSSHRIR